MNRTLRVRPPKLHSINSWGTIFVYVPAKSNPMLPSLASMRDENWPPTRRSSEAAVVCQSSDAAFHCLMSSGVVHARQTSSTGAATVVSIVIFMEVLPSFLVRASTSSSNGDRRDRQARGDFIGGHRKCLPCADLERKEASDWGKSLAL